MLYVVIAGLFDCVISVFAMSLYIYFGKNKNQYELLRHIFFINKLISYICIQKYVQVKYLWQEMAP